MADTRLDRRSLLAAATTALLAAPLAGCVSPPASGADAFDGSAELAALETRSGGRLGAYVLDTRSGAGFGWRQDERFCHCSSFKLSLAALVLREAAAGRIALDEPIRYGPADLMAVSPVTTAHVGEGALPIVELIRAAQVTSDNAAANLVLRRLGGPQAVTRFWRESGDSVSRLDAYEPALNHIPPGTQENSSTPAAMAHTLARILYGDVLSRADAERLRGWMADTQTGSRRIRAGLPRDWNAGDKTGTAVPVGRLNTYVDLPFVAPPGRAPLIVAAYLDDSGGGGDIRPECEATLAGVGRLAAQWASR